MTRVCLGVGCEREPIVLFRLARKPLLLFRHGRGIRPEKSQSIESIVEYVNIQFSRLRLLDYLPHFIEALQGKHGVDKVYVWGRIIWGEAEALAIRLASLLILPLPAVHVAQIEMCSVLSRVVRNLLLKRLRRFIQFPGYIRIVVGGDGQLFPLTGMLPQLECLGEVLAGASRLAQTEVIQAHFPIPHSKGRIALDGTLMVRQGG